MASSDRLELVLRPMAQKLMDLTLGRYQVLEHHRHKIPEFLEMCGEDVENFLVAFTKVDLEALEKEARLAKLAGQQQQQQQQDAGRHHPSEHENRDAEDVGGDASSTSIHLTSEAEEARRIASLTPEAYIMELKTSCERLKASELFLRSMLKDLLGELDLKNTVLGTQAGMVARRDKRLQVLRDAFLRENRQLREIVRQFREKGKCDLPDPVLYEWDTEDAKKGAVNSRHDKGGGADDASGDDAMTAALRAQFQKEKEQIEKSFGKQLETSQFALRTAEAQVTNVTRQRGELQQQVAVLKARVQQLETEAAALADAAQASRQPLPDASAYLGRPGSPSASSGQAHSGVITPNVKSPRTGPSPLNALVPPSTMECGVQTESVVTPPPQPLEVDPTLQDVLSARQASPDGLGAGLVKSLSTTHNPSSQVKRHGTTHHGSGNMKSPRTPRASQLQSKSSSAKSGGKATRAGGHASAPSISVDPAGLHHRSESRLSAGSTAGPAASVIFAVESRGGTSPWADEELLPVVSMEGGAHTPSQLEQQKMHHADVSGLSHNSMRQNHHPSGELGSSAASSLRLHGFEALTGGTQNLMPSDLTSSLPPELLNRPGFMEQEILRLRRENAELRVAATSSVVASSPGPHTQSLLARLKHELSQKSKLLDERSTELEQLKGETMRWFDAYKRSVPPSNLVTDPNQAKRQASDGTANGSLLLNYETLGHLQNAVHQAEAKEEAYRVVSWKLIRRGIEGFRGIAGQWDDCKDAERNRESSRLCHLQRQADMLDHFHRQRIGALRERRVLARADANEAWDNVLRLARAVCRTESLDTVIASDACVTPRYYHGHRRNKEKTPIDGRVQNRHEAANAGQPAVPHSTFFKALSNAAAMYTTLQASSIESNAGHGIAFNVPLRGVSAVSPATLLPTRPQSAGAAHSQGLVPKLRAAVTRPTSAVMQRPSHAQQLLSGHGVDRPNSEQPASPAKQRTFEPAALSGLSTGDRRAMVLAAVVKDRAQQARDKKQLAEERYAFRASACATMPQDMSRNVAPSLHMVKLIGRNEVL